MIDIFCPPLLAFGQLVKVLWKGRRAVWVPARVDTIVGAVDVEMSGYAILEKLGQDGGAFPVNQANDSPRSRSGVGRLPLDDDIALPEVWVAHAKTPKIGAADERGYHSEKAM